jgi:hypothetical protein
MWIMFGLAGALGIFAAFALVRFVVAGFRRGKGTGLMTLLVPGYVFWFGAKRTEIPHKRAWLASGFVALLGAGLAIQFSTAFAPEPEFIEADAPEGLPSFEEMGSFEDLAPAE